MKKIVALACTLALGVVALAGCSDNDDGQAQSSNSGTAAQSTSSTAPSTGSAAPSTGSTAPSTGSAS